VQLAFSGGAAVPLPISVTTTSVQSS